MSSHCQVYIAIFARHDDKSSLLVEHGMCDLVDAFADRRNGWVINGRSEPGFYLAVALSI